MNPQDQVPEQSLTSTATNSSGSSSSRFVGLKNIFVLASFACLAVAIVGSLLEWVKLNIDLGTALTGELNLSAKQNTVIVLCVIMAAVLAITAYTRLRLLLILNLLLTAFSALIVFNQRIPSDGAEIAKNTAGFMVTLLALVANLVVTALVLAKLPKKQPSPVSV